MICVRRARPGDAAAIGAVHVATWRNVYAGVLPDDIPRRPVHGAPRGRLRTGDRRPPPRPRHVRLRRVRRRRAARPAGGGGRQRRRGHRLRVGRQGAAPRPLRRIGLGKRRGRNALPARRLPRPRRGTAADARHGGASRRRRLPLRRALGAARKPDAVVLRAPRRPRRGARNRSASPAGRWSRWPISGTRSTSCSPRPPRRPSVEPPRGHASPLAARDAPVLQGGMTDTDAAPAASGHDRILILDFGSQVTQLIARRLRENGVYCEIWPFNAAPERAHRRIRAARHRALRRPGQRHRRRKPARPGRRFRGEGAGARHLLRPAGARGATRRHGREPRSTASSAAPSWTSPASAP